MRRRRNVTSRHDETRGGVARDAGTFREFLQQMIGLSSSQQKQSQQAASSAAAQCDYSTHYTQPIVIGDCGRD